MAHRQAEADHVRSIVSEEVERFTIEVTARQAAPLVAQLHEKAEAVRQAEIERFTADKTGDWEQREYFSIF